MKDISVQTSNTDRNGNLVEIGQKVYTNRSHPSAHVSSPSVMIPKQRWESLAAKEPILIERFRRYRIIMFNDNIWRLKTYNNESWCFNSTDCFHAKIVMLWYIWRIKTYTNGSCRFSSTRIFCRKPIALIQKVRLLGGMNRHNIVENKILSDELFRWCGDGTLPKESNSLD